MTVETFPDQLATLAKFTLAGDTPQARLDKHARQVAEIQADGLHRPPEAGEMLCFPDSQTRLRIGIKYGLDHPDFEERRLNIARFRKSADYRRFRVYRKRLF